MTTTAATYASPADTAAHGEYRIVHDPADPRPLYRFTGRVVAPGEGVTDGPDRYVAEPGRFHLYAGWFCPWAHRSTIVLAVAGLGDAVSVSYVDGARDARGWAFRETHGPDPVNGFTLLRQAYDATEPGFDGHVSVPALWDRRTGRVASNTYATLDADLATAFGRWSTTGVELYPADLRDDIDALDARIGPAVNHGVSAAGRPDGAAARERLGEELQELDRWLGGERYLLGDRLTLADVRLWVTLVRYDVHGNEDGALGPHLAELPSLWAYARSLYQHPAIRSTTDLSSFTVPGAAAPDWDEPAHRG